jgi:chorismate dehydratase
MAPVLRISVVDYVNAWPLTWGFLRGAVDGVERLTDTPAACADRLARGEVDAGLIPSVEAARIPGLRIVRGIGIASHERVRSVVLASRRPLEGPHGAPVSVALDTSSRSSAVMVRILMQDLLHLRAEFHPAAPDLDEMLKHYDAALLIGDPALKANLTGLNVLDLAEGWRRLTGLPFVFAVWAVRPHVAPEPFLWARDYGHNHMPEIVEKAAERTGLPESVLSSYLKGNLHHDLDAEDEKGLREFYRRAYGLGLIASPDPPPFAGVPLVPQRER